jgi:hypothetical protein
MNDNGAYQHAHSCNHNYCSVCIPELSPDYWRKRAHQAEEHAEALEEHARLLISRIGELDKETERLANELSRFWS